MNGNKLQLTEFIVLILWAVSIGVMSVLKHDIGMGASTAFSAFAAAAAVKVTLG